MKQKNTLYFLLIVMAIVLITSAFATENIKVTFVSQNPDPVDANKNVELRFKIENVGTNPASNVILELLPKFPFSLDSDVAERDLGTLNAQMIDTDAVIVKYTLHTDTNAADGNNDIQIRYKSDGEDWVTQDFYVQVNANLNDSYLNVINVKTDPETLEPGKPAKIIFTLENAGRLQANDITTKLDLSSQALPIAPSNSVTEKRITSLDIGDTVDVEYDVMIAPDATEGLYKIPLSLTFQDYDNNIYTQNDLISAVIGSEPQVSYWIDTSNFIFKGMSNTVSVKFVNKGISDIHFLYVQIGDTKSYDVMSPKEVYLGDIVSDDYQTADYVLFINANSNDTISIPITFTYMDKNNNEYTKQDNLSLNVYSQGDPRIGNQKSAGLGTIIIVIIILAIILFFVIRAFKKKKKN